MSIICYQCGNVDGPWIRTFKGFLCEDCRNKLTKEKQEKLYLFKKEKD